VEKSVKNEKESKQKKKHHPQPQTKEKRIGKSLTPSPLLSSLSSLNEQRPLVLQGEESDMSSNYILFELYLQGILFPSLFGEGLGDRLPFLS